MGRRRYSAVRKRRRKRGRGLPYVYNNKIFFGKKTSNRAQKVLVHLLQNVGDIIGI